MDVELETRGIQKRFGSVIANASIDLVVDRGEIHAIMGENGAGKSTLMSILYGMVQPDEGEIWLRGERVQIHSPIEAIRLGLGMVHQAFRLFNSLTVWENIAFGAEPARGIVIDRKTAREKVAALAEKYRLPVTIDAIVDTLPVGVRQRVEILKALYRDVQLLILDEPTAVLTPQEITGLFGVLNRLRDDGKTILFVTHKLHEVMAVTQSITVLRDGRVTSRLRTAETNEREVVRAMTGRNVNLSVAKRHTSPGKPTLEVHDLEVASSSPKSLVSSVSLSVAAGEVVGIAGVAGNGQTELVEAIVGLRVPSGGLVKLEEVALTLASVAMRRSAGVAYIPEDRARTGTALSASAAENLNMGVHRQAPQASGWLVRTQAVRNRAAQLIKRFGIKISAPETKVGTLSGGNLQKVVIARELSHHAKVLVAEQPTRGVDVGAIEYIREQLIEARDAGLAILLVSSELSEVLALSDRIHVMFDGRLTASIDASEASEESLGLLMTGEGAFQ